MRVTKQYIRTPRKGLFRTLWIQGGYKPYWTYWAEGHSLGMGKAAREAVHNARKRGVNGR